MTLDKMQTSGNVTVPRFNHTLSIVVPVYNSKGTLSELLSQTRAACEGLVPDFEVVCVDDGSRDGSAEELQRLAAIHPFLRLQPSYVPWRGYFDLINMADVFIFYDDVQYDKHGWRNRNLIKTAQGPQWLTIPVLSKGAVTDHLLIKDARIATNPPWSTKHWRSIEQSYKKAPFFNDYAPVILSFYSEPPPELLAEFTIKTTIELARLLGITRPRFVRSSELPAAEGVKTERLVNILSPLNVTRYISGPSASDYLEPEKLEAAGISLEYIAYKYPDYPQLHGAFESQVSVLDLLFNTGPDAAKYIWNLQS